MTQTLDQKTKVAIIGLGYVGLPLAAEFGKKFSTTGFDIQEKRIEELRRGIDRTLEVNSDALKTAQFLHYTSKKEDLRGHDFYIVTVPTPVDEHHRPDLTPLMKACETVGSVLSKGSIVVFESTVYPGCTEEDCVPLLEKYSGLKFNKDFFCGYSPERINPGDKEHTLPKILKITSGSTAESAEKVDHLYRSIITAGTYRASSIKVAEAAKVIENSQRDINIAFVNELSLIFDRMNIDTMEVLEAAGTKWNFLKFRPGLVGGHCIGVDPYYLTHKAQSLGYHPEVILSGRRINDNMGMLISQKIVKLMIQKGIAVHQSKVLVLGLTFKENCPDIRNSKVVDVIRELKDFGCQVDVFEPWADPLEVQHEYGFDLMSSEKTPDLKKYQAVVLCVAHQKFSEIKPQKNASQVYFDVKSFWPKDQVDGRL